MKVILIYSGGLDSTVLLYHLRDQQHDVHCLGLDYGQRHHRELQAGQVVSAKLGIDYQVVDISSIRPLLAGSSLTDDIPVPMGAYSLDNMKTTVVPNRNMILLAIALGWAVSLKAEAVAYAAHAGDHILYSDCRPEFAEAMDRAAALCNWEPVRIIRPFIGMSKGDIVRRGGELGVPFELTWSCYQSGEWHCGRCGTCVERRRAFAWAGVPDPTGYDDIDMTRSGR